MAVPATLPGSLQLGPLVYDVVCSGAAGGTTNLGLLAAYGNGRRIVVASLYVYDASANLSATTVSLGSAAGSYIDVMTATAMGTAAGALYSYLPAKTGAVLLQNTDLFVSVAAGGVASSNFKAALIGWWM